MLHTLQAIILILLVTKILGAVMKHFRQPQVMGEIIGGIVLGPTLLASLFPAIFQSLWTPEVKSQIGTLADLGVIFFMFTVGLGFDGAKVRKKLKSTLAISLVSVLVPLALGAAAAFYIYPRYASSGVSFPLFALFSGVAISVTAFPVLARILKDLKIERTPLAAIVLGSAALDDVAAWCFLALIVGLATGNSEGIRWTLGFTVLLVVVMASFGKRFLSYLENLAEDESHKTTVFSIITLCVIGSAYLTELIGIHAIFGAFLVGACLSPESTLAKDLQAKIAPLTSSVLLPLFFAVAGLNADIGLLLNADGLSLSLIVLVLAILGKFGAASFAAYISGIDARNSFAIGALMNTRGLVELIVLNLGLRMGFLNPTLFSAYLVMTLVTTLMTTPLFHFITRSRPWALESRTQTAP